MGLFALTCVLTLAVLVPMHFWLRHRGAQVPPAGFLAFVVVPHLLFCTAAGVYGADRIFGDEQRRGTLESLRLLPIRPSRWVVLRLAWPGYLVTVAWLAGMPFYLVSALNRVGSLSPNLLLSLLPLAVGLGVIPLVLLLPPDFRERMRAARLAGSHRRVKVDADLTLCWMINLGLWFLVQYSVIGVLGRRTSTVALYTLRVPLGLVWVVVALIVLWASAVVATASISQEERRERLALRARLVTLAVLYYALLGLILGLMWTRLPLWAQWGPPLAFPVWAWYLLRQEKRPREDRWSASEMEWVESRWQNPLLIRDLRSFTRFSSLRRWMLGELLALAGIYAGALYLFVWRSGATVAETTEAFLTLATLFGTVIIVADATARPFALWMRERTTGTLPLLFLVPRESRELLRGRLQAGMWYSLVAHLPLLLVVVVGTAWRLATGSDLLGVALLTFSPIAALFLVVLGCTVQPQTGPPWRWLRDDWLEVLLALVQVALIIAGAALLFAAALGRTPHVWPMAAALFFANSLLIYGCYRIRVRQFEALRVGDRELSER